MMRRSAFVAILNLAVAVPAAWASPKIGDKAPAVKAAKWFNGSPPSLPGDKNDGKHAYLVEFWATWCGPCMRSVPHLAELHRKYQKDGLVVIGMSNEDPEVVAKFLDRKTNGKKIDMPYFVAVDADMGSSDGYMKDIDGIPHAFLVDKTNTIVWSGNPLGDTALMDSAIPKVLAGTYDLATAKKAVETNKKFDELLNSLQPAYMAKDKDRLFKIVEEMIALKPLEVQPYLIKRHFLGDFNMVDQIEAWDAKTEDALKDSAKCLMQLVDIELEKNLAERNPGRIARCSKRAVDITKEADADALGLLARIQCEMGQIDAAITTQTKAVALASGPGVDEAKKVLKYYETVKELGRKLSSSAARPESSGSQRNVAAR